MVVLPTPRTPVSIQACAMRPVEKALVSVRTIGSWPMRRGKVGRAVFAREHPVAAGGLPCRPFLAGVAHSAFDTPWQPDTVTIPAASFARAATRRQ